jgi:hypothetical protein
MSPPLLPIGHIHLQPDADQNLLEERPPGQIDEATMRQLPVLRSARLLRIG